MAKFLNPIIMLMIFLLAFFATAGEGVPMTGSMVELMDAVKAMPAKLLVMQTKMKVVTEKIQKFSDRIVQLEKIQASLDAVGNAIVLCGHHQCQHGKAYFHEDKDLCVCQPDLLPLVKAKVDKDRLHPNTKCEKRIVCDSTLTAAYNPFSGGCVCSLYLFTDHEGLLGITYEPNKIEYEKRLKEWNDNLLNEPEQAAIISIESNIAVATAQLVLKEQVKRDELPEIPGAVPFPPLPVFVPPPKTDTTPALIEQSLEIKPQQNAIIHSIIPHFADGVITFYAQLDGPIPQSLQLNATDSMSCGTIGFQPDPNLIIVPQHVNEGVKDIVIPDCLVIAVNKLNASWINYWVQKTDGSNSIYSLLGDAQIHDIDQLDTSKPATLAIRASASSDQAKRDLSAMHVTAAHMKREQVFAVHCDNPCVKMAASPVKGSSTYCGCLVNDLQVATFAARGVEAPDAYNAVMTAEACAAMICVNNGNKTALFNPFSKTCWCAAPAYVEVNDSAHVM